MLERPFIQSYSLPRSFEETIDKHHYRSFLEKVSHRPDISQAVFTFPFACDDPLSYQPVLNPEQEFSYYWEKPDALHAIAAGGSLHQITSEGPNRFKEAYKGMQAIEAQTLQWQVSSKLEEGLHFLGGFSFFSKEAAPEWSHFPAASLTLARRLIVKRDNHATLSIALSLNKNRSPEHIHEQLVKELAVFNDPPPPQIAATPAKEIHAIPLLKLSKEDRSRWTRSITRAKQDIANKKLDKVVLARKFSVQIPKGCQPVQVINRLRNRYPHCYSFLIQHKKGDAFIGCSPEQLLAYQEKRINTEALAGSMARGSNRREDQRLKDKLRASMKNKREHQYVVQAIEEQLQSYVKAFERPAHPLIKKLANVQHLHTPIQAQMKNGTPPFLLLNRLHPTPAVGGYPRKEAFHYIRKAEPFDRGWFAGPVGWAHSNGSGEFAVAIRSGLMGDEKATLYAGCGIVANSDPEIEWQETNLKFLPMLSALRDE